MGERFWLGLVGPLVFVGFAATSHAGANAAVSLPVPHPGTLPPEVLYAGVCADAARPPRLTPSDFLAPFSAGLKTFENGIPSEVAIERSCCGSDGITLEAVHRALFQYTLPFSATLKAWSDAYPELAWLFQTTQEKMDENQDRIWQSMSELRSGRNRAFITDSLHDFKGRIFGLTGELKAALRFHDRLIQRDVRVRDGFFVDTREEALMIQHLHHSGNQIVLPPTVHRLAANVTQASGFFSSAPSPGEEDPLRVFYEVLLRQYPSLFEPTFFGSADLERYYQDNAGALYVPELIKRLNRLEIADLVLVGRNKPLAWMEVKSRTHPVTLADVSLDELQNHKRKTILFSLLQMWELRKIFHLEKIVELEVYFPNGIEADAKWFLENKMGFKVYVGFNP